MRKHLDIHKVCAFDIATALIADLLDRHRGTPRAGAVE